MICSRVEICVINAILSGKQTAALCVPGAGHNRGLAPYN